MTTMSNSGGSRVSIPNSVRKTIQDIKEITSKHSEEDIYAMLKECSMDPNETTQRLLDLDSFHEVKRKRVKKKESVKSRSTEELRGKLGYQGRGNGPRGNSYSQYTSNDAGGRRNAANRKENGVEESREKGFSQSPVPVAKGADPIQPLHVEKSSFVTTNGPTKVPNGTLSGTHGARSSVVGDTHDASANSSSRIVPKANIERTPSSSDTVLAPSRDSEIATAAGAIKHEMQIQQRSGDQVSSISDDKGLGTMDSMRNSHLNQDEPQNVHVLEVSSSMFTKEAIGQNVPQPKILGGYQAAEKVCGRDNDSVSKSSLSRGVDEAALKLEKLKFHDGQHVIIPDHIQVPDAVKNVLSFGSLDANFGVKESHLNGESNVDSKPVPELAHEEIACDPPPCDQEMVSRAPEGEGENFDHLQSPSHGPGKTSPSDPKISSAEMAPKTDKLKEEILPAVGPPFPVVQTSPSYSFGFMPPMQVSPLVQPEAFDSQAPASNSLNGSSPPISTSASTPPPTQSGGAQNSVPLSPQPIALFRQPFPPNYIPYSHYYSPFYLPPTMHQYFGHTAFPPPLPTGNMYLTPPAAAVGMKMSPSPYKPGANTAGLPSGYGAYNSSQVAIGPNVVVTSGNSSSSEDLMPSSLKENNGYPSQQSEGGPALWLPGAGRDLGSFPLNSFMNVSPQGQPVISLQSAPGAFAVYHTLQPMASPPPGLTLLHQPSQAMLGSSEPVGPPSNNAYPQQPQRQQQQMNWNM